MATEQLIKLKRIEREGSQRNFALKYKTNRSNRKKIDSKCLINL